MSETQTPQTPLKVAVEAGENYYWCTCGKTSTEPFCDGSHKGSGLKSLLYTPETSETVSFCTCKKTKTPPLCDGSHACNPSFSKDY